MLNPLYTENYNHNVLISSAGVTITYKFTSFSLNPLLMRRLWRDFCLKLWVSFIGYHSKCRMNPLLDLWKVGSSVKCVDEALWYLWDIKGSVSRIKLYATLIYSWLGNKFVTFWKTNTDLPLVSAIVLFVLHQKVSENHTDSKTFRNLLFLRYL